MQQLQKMWNILNSYVEKIIFAPLFRRLLDGMVYLLLPIILLGLFALESTVPVTIYIWALTAGSLAQALLFVILFMKPIGVIFDIRILKRALVYRRQMGVTMLYLALFHFAVTVIPERIFDGAYYAWDNNVLYGALALIITVILGMTSNNRAQRFLRRSWKKLHYAAYPLLFLVLLHAGMASGEVVKVVALTPLFIVLKTLEYRNMKIVLPIISQKA